MRFAPERWSVEIGQLVTNELEALGSDTKVTWILPTNLPLNWVTQFFGTNSERIRVVGPGHLGLSLQSVFVYAASSDGKAWANAFITNECKPFFVELRGPFTVERDESNLRADYTISLGRTVTTNHTFNPDWVEFDVDTDFLAATDCFALVRADGELAPCYSRKTERLLTPSPHLWGEVL